MDMKFTPLVPPRSFDVGLPTKRISLKDCGHMHLEADEQITFTTEQGGEFDVTRKPWGFYATPSLNDRLPRFGLRAALTRSSDGKFFVKLVERGREAEFHGYMEHQAEAVVCWLDEDDALLAIQQAQTG